MTFFRRHVLHRGIWSAVLDEIAFRSEKQNIALPKSVRRVIQEFGSGIRADFSPELARRLMEQLASLMVVVVIIDEFDRVSDVATRQTIADTIKFFSDRNVPATLVLIGVSDDVESLIAEHQSTERCIVQVRMRRMTRDEIETIVVGSLKAVGMSIETAALHEISRISMGLPHYAHLIGLYSARQAIQSGSKKIMQGHVGEAVDSAVQRAQVTIQNAYQKATISTKKNALYKQVLLACALAEPDEFGYFSPSAVKQPLRLILKRDYGVEAFARHLHTFCEPDHGPALRKADLSNRPRFRFDDPLMQPFVLMKGLRDRTITDADLRATRDKSDPQMRLF